MYGRMDSKRLLSLFENGRPEKVIFWTGAGISIQAPTCLPIGAELTRLCINTFMPFGTFSLVNALFSLGNFKDSYGNKKELPRLELIIENIVGALGFRAFNYFSFMDIPRKYLNCYHLFFGKHIEEGGTHFTLNLDNGIDSFFTNPAKFISDRPNQLTEKSILTSKLIKLHGTITNKTSYEDLGLILKNITVGFNNALAGSILNSLIESKLLCFIGYGGVDSFDVIPFFEHFIRAIGHKSLNDLTVIWIAYNPQDSFQLCKPEDVGNGGPIILSGLKGAGAKIYAFKGNGAKLVSLLRRMWGWNFQNTQLHDSHNYDWKKVFSQKISNNPVSDEIKNLIAGQYMAALGVGTWAVYFCNPSGSTDSLGKRKDPKNGIYTSQINQWWKVYTNGLRDLGKYGQAVKRIKEWELLADSTFDKFVALSRLMGEYRIRGNFLKAFLTYRKAKNLRNKISSSDSSNPDSLFALDDFWITYLHIHRDLWKRFSNVRRILFYPWRNLIGKAWVKAFLINWERPSPHSITKLYVLAEKIFKQTEFFIFLARLEKPTIPTQIRECFKISDIINFLETDSLLGDINYQRETFIDGRESSNEIIDEIKSNLLKAQTILDWPGMWKAHYRLAKEYLCMRDYIKANIHAKMALEILKSVEYSIYYRLDYVMRLLKLLLKSKAITNRLH